MTKILLIRHGATAGNLQKRYIGTTDEPLCPLGIVQAKALRQQHFRPDVLFASPMLRTRQTARLVFPSLPCTTVSGFCETNFGLFEGKTAAELAHEPAYQAWVDSGCMGPIPGGEAVADFKARCCAAFGSLLPTLAPNICAAFVLHGGVIMSILEGYALPHRGFYDYHIGNGEFIRCRWDGKNLWVD